MFFKNYANVTGTYITNEREYIWRTSIFSFRQDRPKNYFDRPPLTFQLCYFIYTNFRRAVRKVSAYFTEIFDLT